ncbi:hypothetical protein [Nocardia vulneris]|uniref:Uncharacterized protein n=1 Tax=Nocardia vulneris TaxID=1141657 RepID=A0ABR4Z670_9NOCA|nr:hypothetical protein [Nocardia vulneris]KIA60835.1 hypothetical protein FG87_34690 [Nocardia vulneris]
MTNDNRASADQALAELRHAAQAKTTSDLGQTLEFFDQQDDFERVFLQNEAGLGANERRAQQIIVDTLCERHPEITVAYQQWKRDPGTNTLGTIVSAAIRGLGPCYVYRHHNNLVCGTLAEYALAWQHSRPTPKVLSPDVIAADSQCLAVSIEELDGYDNGMTTGTVYRFTAGEDVIEHRVPTDIFDADPPAADSKRKRRKGNGRILIARLDESYADSTTGKQVHKVREVPFKVRLPSVCDHREGSICSICARTWQLDYDFAKGRFPFPRAPRARVADLINNGILRPGTRVDSGTGVSATITEDGGLLLPDGRIFYNQAAAKMAAMNTLPARRATVGGELPDVPSDCWHVERIRHYPESDPIVVVAIDAASATEAEQRALAWARHPGSEITAELDEVTTTAHTDIGSGRWTVLLHLTSGRS